jgi:hypothetical protein
MKRPSKKKPSKNPTQSSNHHGIVNGYRNGLEGIIGEQILRETGLPPEYETRKIRYIKPETKHTYTPDFLLPNGIIIETKGYFPAKDRLKHLYIKAQHPELDIRFVFSNPNTKLSKASPTTYAKWCEKHGFKYAKGWIPAEWFNEEAL